MKFRRWVATGSIAIVAVIGIVWLSTHGRMTLELPGADGTHTAVLTSADGQQVDVSAGSHILRSGNYTIEVTSDSGGWLGIVRVPRFMGNTAVMPVIKAEADRSFVGDNPGACTSMIQATLVSYACQSTADSIVEHASANDSTPTRTLTMPASYWAWDIEGILTINGKTYLFTHEDNEDDGGAGHYMYQLDHGPKVSGRKQVATIPVNSVVRYIPAGTNGYAAYNTSTAQTYVAASVDAAPVEIKADHRANYSLQDVHASADTTLLMFSDNSGEPSEDEKASSGKSEIIAVQGEYQKRINLDGSYMHAVLCGQDLICAVSIDKRLTVVTTDGKQKGVVNGISEIAVIQNKLLIQSESGVAALDTATLSGNYIYSFGKRYTPCGLTAAQNTPLICVLDGKGGKYMLRIDMNKTVTLPVDKAIANLFDQSFVTKVSPYQNHIFVTVDKGSIVYRPESNSYGYSQQTLNQNKQLVADVLAKAGIGSSYKIVVN